MASRHVRADRIGDYVPSTQTFLREAAIYPAGRAGDPHPSLADANASRDRGTDVRPQALSLKSGNAP